MHINKYIPSIETYIKDTNHFIEITKGITLEEGDKIISLDISSLYTNIPHEEGVQAVEKFLSKHMDIKKAKMLAEITKLVLSGNIREFNILADYKENAQRRKTCKTHSQT